MQPLIRSVLDGYNVCIFAYGQTGSRKTHTMTGPKEITEKSQGVNYRALGDLFHIADQRKDIFHYDVYVQMIEIYNEQVRDLLVTDGTKKRYPFTSYLILYWFFITSKQHWQEKKENQIILYPAALRNTGQRPVNYHLILTVGISLDTDDQWLRLATLKARTT
ncbi:kinesin-like protein KIN-14I [Cajanus cajan]|uniref:kinesin-like protein KIN-14I n=1 Tax=Cajanus cajan TaxID=3821 RepID=UPI00098DD43C|nr:kinesin-like protein KIN-14I [Cajanus cajan]